jgi:hypothetical protein
MDGSERITDPDDSLKLLPHGIYFFHIRWSQLQTSIYSSCRNWTYPHGKAPNSWVGSWTTTIREMGNATFLRVSTSLSLSPSRGRLVPTKFYAGICLGNANISLSHRYWLDGQVNSISLRCDIHRTFDAGSLAIVRKDGIWVNYFVKPTTELGIFLS